MTIHCHFIYIYIFLIILFSISKTSNFIFEHTVSNMFKEHRHVQLLLVHYIKLIY